MVALSPRDVEAAHQLRRIRGKIRGLEAEAAVLRDQLLAALDGSPVGVTAGGEVVAEVRIQTRHSLDTAKVRALFPEVWLQCRKETDVTVLSTPPPKTRRDRAREAGHPVAAEVESEDLIPPLPEWTTTGFDSDSL